MTPNYEQMLYFLAEADLIIIKLMTQLAKEHPPENFDNDPNFAEILELITEGTLWCDALRMVSGVAPMISDEAMMTMILTQMLNDAFK